MAQRKHAPSKAEGFDIEHLAELARIDLTDEEKERLTAEIGRILTHVEQARSVDTAGVPETAQVTGLANVFRDKPLVTRHQSLGELRRRREKFLAAAVETKDGFVKIPAIFGDDS